MLLLQEPKPVQFGASGSTLMNSLQSNQSRELCRPLPFSSNTRLPEENQQPEGTVKGAQGDWSRQGNPSRSQPHPAARAAGLSARNTKSSGKDHRTNNHRSKSLRITSLEQNILSGLKNGFNNAANLLKIAQNDKLIHCHNVIVRPPKAETSVGK